MNDYTVAIMNDYGWTETCKPIAIGVTKAVANSIRRHYEKVVSYNDYMGTGSYVTVINRQFCTNHEDFEVDTTSQM